jgi:hypothetical protein
LQHLKQESSTLGRFPSPPNEGPDVKVSGAVRTTSRNGKNRLAPDFEQTMLISKLRLNLRDGSLVQVGATCVPDNLTSSPASSASKSPQVLCHVVLIHKAFLLLPRFLIR